MLRTVLTLRALLPAVALGLALGGGAQAASSPTQVYLAADGRGGLQMLWWIPPERWRAGGFRLEDDHGRVLVERAAPGADAGALRQLNAADQATVRRLATAKGGGDAIALGIHALGNWSFARALGLGVELEGLTRRPTGFVLRGLGRDGKPDGTHLETRPIDLAKATPLHTPPAELRAASEADGVRLYWRRPLHHLLPVLAYAIERDDDEGTHSLTPQPLVTGLEWPAGQAVFTDPGAPLESEVGYRVYAIDALGRRSQAAEVQIFVPDHRALEPPAGVTAQGSGQNVEIRWQANASPYTVGYVVERSPLLAGPYEALTPDGIPRDRTRYRDTPPPRAATLFYRVRAIDPRGGVGAPSEAALARVAAAAPPAPTGLRADAGQTRVRLRWDPAPGAYGYRVERRVPNGAWQALDNLLTREPRLDDQLGPTNGVRLEYRVSAVAWGDAVGPASKPVVAEIPDTQPPSAPEIVAADSDDGTARLRFRPAAPEKETVRLLVLRGGPDDPGLVIGDPLPGDAREWRDTWVLPGETYWYRLVALDAAGNRSDPGAPVSLRIGAAALPAPPQPQARYEAKPFPRVIVRFAAPPADSEALLEVRPAGDPRWRQVAAVATGGEAVDTHPLPGTSRYRIRWRGPHGTFSPPSPTHEITIR